MTIHVLHAGDGYVYLTRSVAAGDRKLGANESLASYYVGQGHPPGRWMGAGADVLNVAGAVTEEQMRALFGEGRHPDSARMESELTSRGATVSEARKATRLGRRFPRYRWRLNLTDLVGSAYRNQETALGRKLTDDERLTVRQRATADAFQRRHGRLPLDPIELDGFAAECATKRRDAVAGYDMVFTPVKSVALLWGIGSSETRRQIFEAHQAAVADALAWLEHNATFTRSGDLGQAQIDVRGVTAAAFHHWDSRAGDPDLHTHLAVSNKVQGTDGKWRSLDGRALFAAAVSLSERYNTRIEDELRDRLGVEFVERSNSSADRRPVREIVGVPTQLIEGFSKRRQGIEQQYQDLLHSYRRDHGRDPNANARVHLYQQATLAERPDKVLGRSLRDLVVDWRAEADVIMGQEGTAVSVETTVLHKASPVETPDVNALADNVLSAVAACRATWTIHNIRAEAHRQTRPFAVTDRDHLVESVVAAATAPRRCVRIATPRSVAEPAELQRADGESVFVEHASERFTTVEMLNAEERIVAAAKTKTRHRVPAPVVEAAIEHAKQCGTCLKPEQETLVRAFVSADSSVLVALAPAGSGKTTAMRVAVDAWRSTGRRAVALAPSAVAAGVLGEELGIEADTLAKFDHDRPVLSPGTLILVDEAGMAGTMMLDRLIAHAQNSDSVVRLLGDDQQLAAVEAGGVIRHLAHEVGAVRMHQVVRFADPAEAAATLHVRDGDPAAVDFYVTSHRITAGTSETAPEAAYQAWLEDATAGRESLLLASKTADVTALNGRARADLIIAGRVCVDGVQLKDGNAAGVGDHVATRRNERRLAVHRGLDWVKNGDGWKVLAVHADGAVTVEHRRHGGRVTLPQSYVSTHLELDYARSIRRAQGMTVDRAHLVVEPRMAREDLYVGVSRARHGTHLYVAVASDPGPGHLPDVAGSARDVLAGIISRTSVELSATEAVREALASLGNLRRMAVEYDYACGVHLGDRYRDTAEAIHPGLTADSAWPSVAARLHRAEAAGWTAEQALRKAEQMGGFADAHSQTQVMAFRLDRIIEHSHRYDRHRHPVPDWLAAAPPPRFDSPWEDYLPARYEEMASRIRGLVQQAQADPDAVWVKILTGGRPEHHDEAMRQVVSYRSVYEINTPDPLGPEPDEAGRQHQAWRSAHAAILTCQQSDPAAASGAARMLAHLSETPQNASTNDYPSTAREGPARHR